MESLRQAVEAGADAVEFDIRLSADGVAVVHHDPTVERTTDGAGEVAHMTFDELSRLDAGANFTKDAGRTYPYRGKEIRIPAFREVLEAFPSTPLLIEIKTAAASQAVKDLIEQHGAEERCVVDSFVEGALDIFRESDIAYGSTSADVARLMREVVLYRPITPFSYRALCIPLNYHGLPLPVRRFARIGPKHNCRVHVWTINDPRKAVKLWKAGVNGIITDDPKLMLETRAREFERSSAPSA